VVEKRLCKRCLEFKWQKGRGLCETCWKVARSQGFEHYPTKTETQPGLVCRCYSPVRETLPLWDVVQCKRCGKKVL
jgi:hypothetical protein